MTTENSKGMKDIGSSNLHRQCIDIATQDAGHVEISAGTNMGPQNNIYIYQSALEN